MPAISKTRRDKVRARRREADWLNGKPGLWEELRFAFGFIARARATTGYRRQTDPTYAARLPQPELADWTKARFHAKSILIAEKLTDGNALTMLTARDESITVPSDEQFKQDARWVTAALNRWWPNRADDRDAEAVVALCGKLRRLDAVEDLFKGRTPFELLGATIGSRRLFRAVYAMNLHYRMEEAVMDGLVKKCPHPGCPRPFFLNESGKQEYCSHAHAQAQVHEKRKEKAADCLAAAQNLADRWKPGRSDWKKWVAKRTGLTVKFLTRHVNGGRLRPPKGEIGL